VNSVAMRESRQMTRLRQVTQQHGRVTKWLPLKNLLENR